MFLQTLPWLILFAGMGDGNRLSIDPFEYPDTSAARRAWVHVASAPPVEVVRDAARASLEVSAPFASNGELFRVAVDREVRLDLSTPGEFELCLTAEKPEAVAYMTLYFHSGQGWYGANQGLKAAGRQTLTFSKAAFGIEETPAGWDQIDRVRIAFWRARPIDAKIRLESLAANWHDVAVIIPNVSTDSDDGKINGEIDAALDVAERVAGMLVELGLGSDVIDDAAVTRGGLRNRRVAVLAYHPRLDRESTEALARFVADGGKLLACYSIPPQLGRLLGLGRMEYVGKRHAGQFAEIRFTADDVPGLPDSVRQASWNLTVPQEADDSCTARVIARWHDDQGKPTGYPAVLLNDRGAFITHIVLGDDRAGKKRMLSAILGQLDPSLWKTMAQHELERVGPVGHCNHLDATAEHVRQSDRPAVVERLDVALAVEAMARKQFAAGNHVDAIDQARRAHALLVDAYLRTAASPTREGRAFWNHSGTGAYDGDWDRTAKELAAAGFNMVLPNMLWGGVAHYPSDVLPRSDTHERLGDQIAQCTAACAKHGIEVHVWKVNWNLSGAPRAFVERMRRENRTQVNVTGESTNWLCPSHPKNQALELDSMLEVARKYDVAGLHFDYIRYPGRTSCYCDGCRLRFEADVDVSVDTWPQDAYSGTLRERYNRWRCDQITRLVAAVRAEAKKLRPELKISAAVFGSYPDCRESVAQDWPTWVEAGYLDFVCPMDYTGSDLTFTNLVSRQKELVAGRIPIYPGIGATASSTTLPPDRVAGQIHLARQLGVAGFTVFNLHTATAAEILPAMAAGPGASPAVPPHRD